MQAEELSVIVVEPSQAQYLALAAQLAQLGVGRVEHALDAGSALRHLREGEFDLVISTMHLPDMTGADLVRVMRSEEALADTPFVLLCSEQSHRYLEPARQAGAAAILHKPTNLVALRHVLSIVGDLVAPESLAHQHPEIAGFRVLVVDDMASARRFIAGVLGGLGIHDIVEAADGQEAAEILQTDEFDLVVTDYNMPRMDGAALVRHIREESRQPGVPVLMVTSEQNLGHLDTIEQAGVSALCDKPFEPAVVRDILERIVLFGRV